MIDHMLWLHNCLTAYGMYEFDKDRYRSRNKVEEGKIIRREQEEVFVSS
jgi:hypothetical protein